MLTSPVPGHVRFRETYCTISAGSAAEAALAIAHARYATGVVRRRNHARTQRPQPLQPLLAAKSLTRGRPWLQSRCRRRRSAERAVCRIGRETRRLQPEGRLRARMTNATMRTNYVDFLKYSLIFVAVAITPVLVWYLFDAILIAVGAMILATLLRLGAEPFTRWLSVPQSVALILSGAFILMILVSVGYFFGTRVIDQMQDVVQRVVSAEQSIRSSLEASKLWQSVAAHFTGPSFSVTELLSRVLGISTKFLEGAVVILISGAYIAAQPRLYREGLIELFPPRLHRSAAETVDDIAAALRLWLIGQLVQMLLIGGLSTLAVWLIGLPAPLALGLIAGITEFVPYLGPILAAIPAVLVAFTKSPEAVLWTIAAYVLIHQAEGHLVVPLVQRRLVHIPPALMLLGIVAMSFLFGAVAMMFAAPIAVILFVAVKKVYVQQALGEQTEISGTGTR
jgi:predicted PurR-regulated permease PerM